MGLGAWLAAETERKHYHVEEDRERREVQETPEAEEEEIYEVFETYGIARDAVVPLVVHLKANEDMWVKVSSSLKVFVRIWDGLFSVTMIIVYFFGGWLYRCSSPDANTVCSS